jgi:arylformamidase
VYKQYDQAALNYQFNNRARVPHFATYLDRHELTSRQAAESYSYIKDLRYGEGERERLDIYPTSKPNAKTLIFIHGGYWYKNDKSLFHFIATGFQSYDINIVFINYPLAPAVSIDQIIESCRKAVKYVYDHVSKEIYVVGHSAGAHLAVMTLIEPGIIKGVCAMSGLYNLLPVQLSDMNELIQISDQAVLTQSPVTLNPACRCPLLIAVGADESEEFREQSEELYASWKKKNMPVQLLTLSGVNHYSIVEEAVDKDSPMHNSIRKLLGV